MSMELVQVPMNPAQKAWATRRARAAGQVQPSALFQNETQRALAAFERAAASEMPDWHAAALLLKRALASSSPARARAPRAAMIQQAKTITIAAPIWNDYPVDRSPNKNIRNPTIVVTFQDGEIVRAPAVSLKGKPLNLGRGLRIAIAFYLSRVCKRRGLPNLPGTRPAVPEITACHAEDPHTGELAETFEAQACTARTAGDRRAQDWRIRRIAP